ncbi:MULTISPECIES: hypothetical protein [Achromobacter]|uniref:hypothetical protein n=1 Tax=Achromobacter TaxID=222 RepID=UPI0023F924B3|nr:hypothetical protein [Achromobacter anxifer]MDF8363354.1 hypothetical protein [Achromobacter anxifer]
MPRTVETIVANHKHARALRDAGKPIWSHSVNIKSVLHEDQGNTSPEHISDISVRIAKILHGRLPARFFDVSHPDFDFGFVETVEFMEECTVEGLAVDKENGCSAGEMFNGWLEEVYDWADRNRVWLGP